MTVSCIFTSKYGEDDDNGIGKLCYGNIAWRRPFNSLLMQFSVSQKVSVWRVRWMWRFLKANFQIPQEILCKIFVESFSTKFQNYNWLVLPQFRFMRRKFSTQIRFLPQKIFHLKGIKETTLFGIGRKIFSSCFLLITLVW